MSIIEKIISTLFLEEITVYLPTLFLIEKKKLFFKSSIFFNSNS
jgi:hypothetical protein